MSRLNREDLRKVADLIVQSHLVLKRDSVIEVYHHLGAEYFAMVGAVFINVVNKEYCKSYAVLLPGQSYPNHYHHIKAETFFVLYGDLTVCCEETSQTLYPGDSFSVERGESHSFSSKNGAVFEELSTTYVKNDSVYENPGIRKTSYEQRKTMIPLEKFKELLTDEEGTEGRNLE